MRTKDELQGILVLVLTAVIWGSGFIGQALGMEHIGPFTFNALRNLVGSVALFPVVLFVSWYREKYYAGKDDAIKADMRYSIIGGICCGLALFIAGILQQVGIQYTDVGKAGFITCLYIVFVPLVGIFYGKKITKKLILCIIIALTGLYFLCINESLTLSKGDVLIFLSAFGFTAQIICIDYFILKANGVMMANIQFLISGILSMILACVWESSYLNLAHIIPALPAILYTGVIGSGVAYTLQIIGQSKLKPSIASLIMSLEAVFTLILAWLILKEAMTMREIFGSVLMFSAIIIAQYKSNEAN